MFGYKTTVLALASFLILLSECFGSPGEAAGDFLLIPPSARAEGMGNAFVALADDAAVLMQHHLGAAKDGGAGELVEHHGHFPVKHEHMAILEDGGDVHLQLLAAAREAAAQRDKFLLAADLLNGILEHDVFMVVRKNMRPIGLALCVVGL